MPYYYPIHLANSRAIVSSHVPSMCNVWGNNVVFTLLRVRVWLFLEWTILNSLRMGARILAHFKYHHNAFPPHGYTSNLLLRQNVGGSLGHTHLPPNNRSTLFICTTIGETIPFCTPMWCTAGYFECPPPLKWTYVIFVNHRPTPPLKHILPSFLFLCQEGHT